jgi:hypothetical protein
VAKQSNRGFYRVTSVLAVQLNTEQLIVNALAEKLNNLMDELTLL